MMVKRLSASYWRSTAFLCHILFVNSLNADKHARSDGGCVDFTPVKKMSKPEQYLTVPTSNPVKWYCFTQPFIKI